MRKIGFTLSNGRIKEILPHSYHIHSLSSRRKMFLSMLSTTLPPEARFEFSRCDKLHHDLYTILSDKIYSFLPFHRLKPEISRPATTLLITESMAINRFLSLSHSPKGNFLSRNALTIDEPPTSLLRHPAALLASLMVNNGRLEMLMDLDDLFIQTVFNRIKPQEGSHITRDNHYIHICENGQITRLHPRWKRVYPKNLSHHKKQIDQAFKEARSDSIDAYYLVYPKMDDFTRHIIVQNHDNDALKIVPYSFTFCTRNQHAKSA